jgi:hypothetical protein
MKWWLVWNGKVSKAFNKKFQCRYKPKMLPDQSALLHWWHEWQAGLHEAPWLIHSGIFSLHRFCKFVFILLYFLQFRICEYFLHKFWELVLQNLLALFHTIVTIDYVNFVWLEKSHLIFWSPQKWFFICLPNQLGFQLTVRIEPKTVLQLNLKPIHHPSLFFHPIPLAIWDNMANFCLGQNLGSHNFYNWHFAIFYIKVYFSSLFKFMFYRVKLRGMFPPIQASKIGWTSLSIFSLFTNSSFQPNTVDKNFKLN